MDLESEKSPVSNNFVENINTGVEIVQRFEKIMKDLKEKVINLEYENNKFKKDNLILENNNLAVSRVCFCASIRIVCLQTEHIIVSGCIGWCKNQCICCYTGLICHATRLTT